MEGYLLLLMHFVYSLQTFQATAKHNFCIMMFLLCIVVVFF